MPSDREILQYVFALFLALVILNMFLFGWDQSWYYKSFPANETNFLRVHYITILTTGTTFFLILSYLRGRPFFKSVVFSGLIPLSGLATFEAYWHTGWWGSVENMKPEFWVTYLVILLLTFVWLNLKWKFFKLGVFPIFMSGLSVFVTTFGWGLYTNNTNFYTNLLLYERGLGPSPHTIPFFALKIIVLLVWVPLVLTKKEGKK
jgi:hypothetical protein